MAPATMRPDHLYRPTNIWLFCDKLANHFAVPRIVKMTIPKILWPLASIIEFVGFILFLSKHYSSPLSQIIDDWPRNIDTKEFNRYV